MENLTDVFDGVKQVIVHNVGSSLSVRLDNGVYWSSTGNKGLLHEMSFVNQNFYVSRVVTKGESETIYYERRGLVHIEQKKLAAIVKRDEETYQKKMEEIPF